MVLLEEVVEEEAPVVKEVEKVEKSLKSVEKVDKEVEKEVFEPKIEEVKSVSPTKSEKVEYPEPIIEEVNVKDIPTPQPPVRKPEEKTKTSPEKKKVEEKTTKVKPTPKLEQLKQKFKETPRPKQRRPVPVRRKFPKADEDTKESANSSTKNADSSKIAQVEAFIGQYLSKQIYSAPVWSWLGALLSILWFRWLYPWPFIVRFFLALIFSGVYILVAVAKTKVLSQINDEDSSDEESEEEEDEVKTQEKVKAPATPLLNQHRQRNANPKPKPKPKVVPSPVKQSKESKPKMPSKTESARNNFEPKIETVVESESDPDDGPVTTSTTTVGGDPTKKKSPFPPKKVFDFPKYESESSSDDGFDAAGEDEEDGRPMPLHGNEDADEEEEDLAPEPPLVEYNAKFAAECKQEGNQHYLKGSLNLALKCYTDAIEFCPPANNEELAVYYANRAAARMQQKQYDKVVEDCSAAIESNPKYLKAYVYFCFCFFCSRLFSAANNMRSAKARVC